MVASCRYLLRDEGIFYFLGQNLTIKDVYSLGDGFFSVLSRKQNGGIRLRI